MISKFKDVTHNYLNEIWNGKHLVLELQKLVVCWFMEKKKKSENVFKISVDLIETPRGGFGFY